MLSDLWRSTDLVQLLDVYWWTSVAIGFAFAMFLWFTSYLCISVAQGVSRGFRQVIGFIRARMLGVHDRNVLEPISATKRWWITLASTAILALVVLAFQISAWAYPKFIHQGMPSTRVLYYVVWLPLNLGGMWTVAWLCIIVAWMKLRPFGHRLTTSRFSHRLDRIVHTMGVVAVLVLVLLTAALLGGRSLVKGEAVRQMVLTSMMNAMGNDVPPNRCEQCGEQQEEMALSAAIAGEGLKRRRDLVITVTILNQAANSDRYVYLPSNRYGAAPTYEQRALALDQSSGLTFLSAPTNLVSFLIASASVFPVFPPRPFQDPLGLNRTVKAVDGGFAHNSPIEAALDWGATHIIVVEASPSPKLEEEATLLSNLRVAFDHLFEQAQMSDRRSRERVEIYYLRPSKELLKTLEFIPGLMGRAIEQGKKDFNNGRFVQFSRPPVFTQIVQTPN